MARPDWLTPKKGGFGGKAQPPSVANTIDAAAAACAPGRAAMVQGSNCPGPGPESQVTKYAGRARNVSTESTGHTFGVPAKQSASTSG